MTGVSQRKTNTVSQDSNIECRKYSRQVNMIQKHKTHRYKKLGVTNLFVGDMVEGRGTNCYVENI